MFSFLHIALFLKIADAKMEEIARQLADCQLNDEAPTPEEQVELRKRYIEVKRIIMLFTYYSPALVTAEISKWSFFKIYHFVQYWNMRLLKLEK